VPVTLRRIRTATTPRWIDVLLCIVGLVLVIFLGLLINAAIEVGDRKFAVVCGCFALIFAALTWRGLDALIDRRRDGRLFSSIPSALSILVAIVGGTMLSSDGGFTLTPEMTWAGVGCFVASVLLWLWSELAEARSRASEPEEREALDEEGREAHTLRR
jgi:hypothetical protein